MSGDGQITLILKNESVATIMAALVDDFVPIDLSLEHKVKGEVIVWDENGMDYHYKRNEFFNILEQRMDTTFQWWWGLSYDTSCRLRRISNYFLIDFSIYFSQQLHTYRLLSCIEQVYRHFDRCGTVLGLVFDSVGFTCEYPWIDIVISGETEIGLPEKLVFCFNGYGTEWRLG